MSSTIANKIIALRFYDCGLTRVNLLVIQCYVPNLIFCGLSGPGIFFLNIPHIAETNFFFYFVLREIKMALIYTIIFLLFVPGKTEWI